MSNQDSPQSKDNQQIKHGSDRVTSDSPTERALPIDSEAKPNVISKTTFQAKFLDDKVLNPLIGEEAIDNDLDVQVSDKSNTESIETTTLQANTEALENQELNLVSKLHKEFERFRESRKIILSGCQQIKRRQKSLQEKHDLLEARFSKLENAVVPMLKFQPMIQEILAKELTVWEEDIREQEKYRSQMKEWVSKSQLLIDLITTAVPEYCDRIKSGEELTQIHFQNLAFREKLSNRYEGLILTQKMVQRLQEDIVNLEYASEAPCDNFTCLKERDLTDLIQSQNDEQEIKVILEKKLREIGDVRYQSISRLRDNAENIQKSWLNFLKVRLLPILDSLDDGENYARDLVNELKKQYFDPYTKTKLSEWLQTYEELKSILLKVLTKIGVIRMDVKIGQPINYKFHEAIDTESDSDLPHESIKEVTRNGYEYMLCSQTLLLRNALVIAVKN